MDIENPAAFQVMAAGFGLEAANNMAQSAHEAAAARLFALETTWKALNVFDEAVEEVAVEDKAIFAALHTSATWLALRARIVAVKAEVSHLEDVAYETQKALDAYEADHPEIAA